MYSFLYDSKSWSTLKFVEIVARASNRFRSACCHEIHTGNVTKEDFVNSAGIIAGSPVYFGVMAADLKRVFDEFVSVRKQMEKKVGAAFATSGFWAGGNETTMISIIQCG